MTSYGWALVVALAGALLAGVSHLLLNALLYADRMLVQVRASYGHRSAGWALHLLSHAPRTVRGLQACRLSGGAMALVGALAFALPYPWPALGAVAVAALAMGLSIWATTWLGQGQPERWLYSLSPWGLAVLPLGWLLKPRSKAAPSLEEALLRARALESLSPVPDNTTPQPSQPLNHVLTSHVWANALDFNTTLVREFMVPRTELVAVPLTTPLEELRARFIATELSRILVYGESLEDIRGYVHARDLFKRPASLEKLLQPVAIVPESLPADGLLRTFTTEQKVMAIVVDEHGGTAGLVTLEDLAEEIIGEIDDEYDQAEDKPTEWKVGEGLYQFSARLEVDYLNQQYGLGLPQGEYATLGGLVISLAERIPEANERFQWEHLAFTVLSAEKNRVVMVALEVLDPLPNDG